MEEKKTFDDSYKKRRTALFKRDAVKYYRLCNFSGIEPEDSELYERGMLEVKKRRVGRRLEQKTELKNNYKEFVREVESLGIPTNLSEWENTKKKLLQKYFPAQFSKQNLNKYSATQIGAIFSRVLNYARRAN